MDGGGDERSPLLASGGPLSPRRASSGPLDVPSRTPRHRGVDDLIGATPLTPLSSIQSADAMPWEGSLNESWASRPPSPGEYVAPKQWQRQPQQQRQRQKQPVKHTASVAPRRQPVDFRAAGHAAVDISGELSARRAASMPARAGDPMLHGQRFRYNYYTKLAPATQHNALIMPEHVIPPGIFTFGLSKKGDQSSLVSILAMWNTMMGTSVLAMPWAIQQAGIALGVGSVVVMMIITMYTCEIIVRHGEGGMINGQAVEFGDVIKIYLGPTAYTVSQLFSILTLVGACMVYWVLMSSFSRNIANFAVCSGDDPNHPRRCTVVPPAGPGLDATLEYSTWWWNGTTVPLYLVVALFPMLNLKSIGFFTRLNSLGVVSVVYLLGFVGFVAAGGAAGSPFGGVHLDRRFHVELVSPNAFSLTGVLTLSYFLHNGALSILRNARRPANNFRDLRVAYCLGCATYLAVGACLYVSFRSDKTAIRQNFLENFAVSSDSYVYAFVAQCFMLLQFVTVLPLLAFIVRFQTLTMLFDGEAWPSIWHVLGLNAALVGVSVCVTIFYPHIGGILRYCGSICGLIYVFAMPSLVEREVLRRKESFTWANSLVCWGLIAFGVANVVGQFVVP